MELAVLVALVGSVLSLPPPPMPEVYIGKCCPREEIMVDEDCRPLNETGQTEWVPDVPPGVRWVFQTGLPICGTRQLWPVYHNGSDRLRLLPDGSLRHIIVEDPTLPDDEIDGETQLHHDYTDGLYCREKKVDSKTMEVTQFAAVCAPPVPVSWTDTDFIMRRILDPVFHVISIFCYLTAAIIHFILPQLRDMMGNILSTMSVCLAISEAADMICIYTEFTSPSAFLTADFVLFSSLLGAFLWLNSLGFYLWKTSRSHNVFLRITDGKKYCYYSYYVWGWTKVLTVIAIISHFFLDVDADNPEHHGLMPKQVAVGWLAVALFFFPIACTILLDLYFYLSTTQVMNSIIMSEYGHIHHKLKHSNKIFFKIFLIMCMYWSFLFISWLPFNGTYYTFVIGNGFFAPIFLYVCILNQKRVRFLLKKVCCFEKCWFPCCRPDNRNDIPEWGEEMLAMYR